MDAELLNSINVKLADIFAYLKDDMIAEISKQDHVATGNLLGSFDYEIVGGPDSTRMNVMFSFYGQFVDRGRRTNTPIRTLAKKVPLDALINWITAKGFETDAKKVRSMAFAVQTTIFKREQETGGNTSFAGQRDWLLDTLNKNEARIENDIFKGVKNAIELSINNLIQEINIKSTGNQFQ